MAPSLIFYGGNYRIAPVEWTACGAPVYDLSKAKRMPAPENARHRGGMGAQRNCGSEDGKLVLYNGLYGAEHSDFQCWNIETGELQWTYPNNYVGVHGGHLAPPALPGLIRAAYDVVGTGRLPEPIGDIFVIATDKGEWHILTGKGFYLTSLFQSDPLKIKFPDPAVPGAVMDNVPPGMGSEDFGGSISVNSKGELYLQSGKTAYINSKVVGLDTVKTLGSGTVTISESDLALASQFKEKFQQQGTGAQVATATRRSVSFTGDLKKDFAMEHPLSFQKSEADKTSFALAYDDKNLYLAWEVKDKTPWANGATEAPVLYASGDTVDFQMGTDTKAAADREKPALGDLRLSIGNFRGTPTAVLYRPVANEKAPRMFVSGTVKEGYEIQSVKVLENIKIEVKLSPDGSGYLVEAAVPLSDLDLKPVSGTVYRGDFGVTFGDPEGKDTSLRSYWNNQATGLVADEVWELVPVPKNWGQIRFE
jgi:hypothetical protein